MKVFKFFEKLMGAIPSKPQNPLSEKVIPVESLKKPKIDRVFFFKTIRTKGLFSKLTQSQVRGMDFILDGWEESGLTDLRWLAYMFATVYHETARTMQPIAEYGKGKGRKYGNKIKMSGQTYTNPDKIYYGRGFVQLTWFENYQKMGRLLGIDLLNNPELAMDASVAMKIMIEGMTKGNSTFGDFTGKSLEMYFNDSINDPKGARRIINGRDKDELIAAYHNKFLSAIKIV